jgi:hypothetical protein
MNEVVEEIMYDYIISTVTPEDMKKITNADDVLECIDEEAEEEIKDRVWSLLKEELNYRSIIKALYNWRKNICNSEIETDDDEREESKYSEDDSDSD